MNGDFSVGKLGAASYLKWLSLTLLSSALSVGGMGLTISHPNRHPLVFAGCMSWLIVLVVSAAARGGLLRMDPRRLRLANWEREGRIYRGLGVPAFRWLLLHSPLGWFAPTLKLTSRRDVLERLLREMNFAEGVHWIAGTLTLGLAAACAAAGQGAVGLWLLLSTIPLHAYPVMVQRSNRSRALRLLRRVALG